MENLLVDTLSVKDVALVDTLDEAKARPLETKLQDRGPLGVALKVVLVVASRRKTKGRKEEVEKKRKK